MNIQRYILPVIIAASLHTGLAFFFGGHNPPPPKPTKDKPVAWEDIPQIAVEPEDPATTAAGDSGGVSELPPSIPDIPREPPKEDIFRIEVRERTESLKPTADLPKIPDEGFGNTGEGKGPGIGGRGPINWSHLDRAPRVTVQTAPPYPTTMSSSGISGSVTVEFVVDTTGRVITADAVRWTHREFADPAVRAVLRWRFEPGTVDGRKVNFRMVVPIEFNAER